MVIGKMYMLGWKVGVPPGLGVGEARQEEEGELQTGTWLRRKGMETVQEEEWGSAGSCWGTGQ